jgi:putative flippase GtrA
MKPRFLFLSAEYLRRWRFFVIAMLAYFIYLLVYLTLSRAFPFFPSSLEIMVAILSGDGVNFLGNRYWVFRATREPVERQGARFFLVMIGTLLLQTGFFWLGRKFSLLPETILLFSLPGLRLVVNYFLHRAFTFRSSSSP